MTDPASEFVGTWTLSAQQARASRPCTCHDDVGAQQHERKKMQRERFGSLSAAVVGLALTLASATGSRADEMQARALFKAMSDYLAAQTAFAFDFDSTLEIVSTDQQKLALASSGRAAIERPDKLHATRTGGFSSVEVAFDGKTLTLVNKDENLYAQEVVPGTVDQLIDTLRETYHRPLPAADLLLADVNAALMPLARDVKDLGSGVIGGVECDHLAFRGEDVDWQIWIAQGDRPYPCRYTITTTNVTGWPEYTVDLRNWTTGAAAAEEVAFELSADARKVESKDMPDFDDLAGIYVIDGAN